MGETIQGKKIRVETEFDELRYEALEREAARLGLSVSQVVDRATATWLQESADNLALFGAAVSGSPLQPNA